MGYKIQKMCGRKIYSRTPFFFMDVHKLNVGVKRWNDKNEIERIHVGLKGKFCLINDLFTKSNFITNLK